MKAFIYAFIFLLSNITLSAQQNHGRQYRQAIIESMYPEDSKVDSNLFAIDSTNKLLFWKKIKGETYVLVVTWKSRNFYPDSGLYNTGSWSPIWVTAAPQLKQRLKKEKYNDVNLRLKQLLGLPPVSEYKVFVEFWVKPSDLFRPCPDNEISDKHCRVCFSHQDSLNTDYLKWFNESRISRYYACGLFNQFPWTQLGYTYDWNPANKRHIGLSEYVIKQFSNVYVNKVYTTLEYLK